ncbi:hypothetical protein DICPUDRAFT_38054 [Dictyostelium purpureum]|uniref:Essential for reactive oxygen species protein n=1 Tax=Dictyostelium purpureum TaxID=5786 RepID=F0ZTT5_DICPU|nr:uncharacterized protein DICPUDRAFT_38054 [Dictyostelium purpureum]EGC32650.1 hypothetical protein DICPUDRAFT_38054 [Dictyostelium purpureum]|eukprot:XP_003290819.1 hypothetical protein DICPUDRAFT_38054 [Dictyostelium purpureum]
MKIIKTTPNELVLISRNRLKEWSLAFAISSIGLLPFLHQSDELFIKAAKVVFFITFVLVGLLGIHEEYNIEFNIKKRKVLMEYKNILELIARQEGRVMVLDLDQVRSSSVQEVKEGKKTLFKLVLDYSDGLKIGLTETYFYYPDLIESIKTDINKWLTENNVVSNKDKDLYGSDDEDDDDQEGGANQFESDSSDEDIQQKQNIKKRTNKVK